MTEYLQQLRQKLCTKHKLFYLEIRTNRFCKLTSGSPDSLSLCLFHSPLSIALSFHPPGPFTLHLPRSHYREIYPIFKLFSLVIYSSLFRDPFFFAFGAFALAVIQHTQSIRWKIANGAAKKTWYRLEQWHKKWSGKAFSWLSWLLLTVKKWW